MVSGCTGLCRLSDGVSRPRKRTAVICAPAQALSTRPERDEEEPGEWETKVHVFSGLDRLDTAILVRKVKYMRWDLR